MRVPSEGEALQPNCCNLVTRDLVSFLCCVEPLAALGQKNDTLLHQTGRRQILPVPEGDF